MNKNLEILSALAELNGKSISSDFIAGEEIELKFDTFNGILEIIDRYSIKKYDVGSKAFRINLRQFTFPIFYNKDDFLTKIPLIKEPNDIGIINYKEKEYLFFDSLQQSTLTNKGIIKNYFIPNTYSYLRIKKIVSSDRIADYSSDTNREIVIISPTKGKLEIGYPIVSADLDINENIGSYEKILLEKLDSKEFSKFLKNELFDFLYSVEKEKRLFHFILNLKTILEAANRNYEIYLSNFSFDQIKNEYDTRKQKYFDELRSIISKLSGYSIGLPISISAASFAAFKSIDSLPTYILIILAFLIFSIYFIFMIRHNKDDLSALKQDFEFDFSSLFKKEFFIRNEAEKKSFLELQKLLNVRIDNLLIKIHVLFAIVIVFQTGLLFILLLQIKLALITILIISGVTLMIFFYLYLFSSRDK
jgi:hypothetical protein